MGRKVGARAHNPKKINIACYDMYSINDQQMGHSSGTCETKRRGIAHQEIITSSGA
jgi:hypothetical protein